MKRQEEKVLSLSMMVDSTLCQQISQGVWKLLTVMKDDEVSAAVRSDFYILLKEDSIYNLEDGIRPANFHKLIQAVKEVAGFDEDRLSYTTPSLALKLGHSLHKIFNIIQCRALTAEDNELEKSTQTLKKNCTHQNGLSLSFAEL